MDTGRGKFHQFEAEGEEGTPEYKSSLSNKIAELAKLYPGHGGIFREGEEVELKGSKFIISKILNNGLKLKLIPKE